MWFFCKVLFFLFFFYLANLVQKLKEIHFFCVFPKECTVLLTCRLKLNISMALLRPIEEFNLKMLNNSCVCFTKVKLNYAVYHILTRISHQSEGSPFSQKHQQSASPKVIKNQKIEIIFPKNKRKVLKSKKIYIKHYMWKWILTKISKRKFSNQTLRSFIVKSILL